MLFAKYIPEDWEASTIWYLIGFEMLVDAFVLRILAYVMIEAVF